MKRKNCILAVILLVIFTFSISNILASEKNYIEYNCDVKNLSLATTIKIYKEKDYFGTITGEVFRFVTDPLNLYDKSGKRVAYAGDAYHFFAQDSHTIYINDGFSAEMVGLIDAFGESYDIYNYDGKKIAYVYFNTWNTSGKMYDNNNNVIADYTSNVFFNDYIVRIYDGCPLDENTVLMIFGSYYSDYHADSIASS